MQDGVAGTVGRGAGALHGRFTEVAHVAAERALVDLAFGRTRERDAVVLKFANRGHRFAAHIFNGVLIAQPVRSFDGVVHMPGPVVFADVAQRSGNTALRGHGVAARGENFCDAGCFETLLHHPEGCAQTRAAGADDDHVVFVINNVEGGHISDSESDDKDGNDAQGREGVADELDGDDREDARAVRGYIVLKHDLHSRLRVMEGHAEEEDHDRRVDGAGQPQHEILVTGAGKIHERSHKPDRKRDERDGGQALHPPVVQAFLGRAETTGVTQRRTQATGAGRGRTGHARFP